MGCFEIRLISAGGKSLKSLQMSIFFVCVYVSLRCCCAADLSQVLILHVVDLRKFLFCTVERDDNKERVSGMSLPSASSLKSFHRRFRNVLFCNICLQFSLP
jgi:hypothetical protein